MKYSWLAFAVFVSALMAAPCRAEESGNKNEQDEVVPLDKVPEAVKKAAKAALAGIEFTSAEKELKKGVTVYELKGKAAGKPYEIKVTADGKVLKVEADDEDDDDDKKAAPAVKPPQAPKGDF